MVQIELIEHHHKISDLLDMETISISLPSIETSSSGTAVFSKNKDIIICIKGNINTNMIK